MYCYYENTPIQIYWKVNHRKIENFQTKNSNIFRISAQNIDCGYSLEPPRRGGSNEYPQSMFLSRNKKNNVYPCKPQLEQFSLHQTITDPTHFTENSSSLIDIILTSDKNNLIYSGIADPFFNKMSVITVRFMASLSTPRHRENLLLDAYGVSTEETMIC